jgi:hypothetical protein
MSNGPALFAVTLPSLSTAPAALAAFGGTTRRRHDDTTQTL